jgi:hypothetical protein
MPEIKNQFTSGKMNKDLDERLVPNGEYRDAMNIQVSTSEGSEVGTIQNILGNSIVPGQGFIPEGAYCVGSIADEKNDKLYYFIAHDQDLIKNGVFDTDASNWTLGTGWEYAGAGTSGYIKGNAVTVSQKINQALSPDVFIEDSYYRIKFKVSGVPTGTDTTPSDGTINLELSNEDGKRFTINSSEIAAQITPSTYNATANGSYEFIKKVGSATSAGSSFWSRFFIQAGTNGFTGNIDNISIERLGGYIVEYDSKSNTVKPVIVDAVGDVLNFSRDRLITGINIIDDMLFWTDNFSEPKKINIPRSIQGTNDNGLVHSNFINTKTSLVVPMKEEHITVIKKQPTHAPKIKLISERESGTTAAGLPWNYSGIMRITSPPNPITVSGQPNTQNTSSMWVSGSGYNRYYDFSQLTVGSIFDTKIETDLNGDSGFFLKWQVGDIIVFKEFGGASFNEIPIIPLTDYSVKAKIVGASGVNLFTDSLDDVISNGDFTIPNTNGTAPQGWTLSPSPGIVYDSANNKINFNQKTDDWVYAASALSSPNWQVGATYRVSFKISNQSTVNTDGVYVRLATPHTTAWGAAGNDNTKALYWQGPGNAGAGRYKGNGEYTFDVTLTPGTGLVADNWGSNHYKILVYTGGEVLPYTVLSLDYITVENLNVGNARVRCQVLEINNPPTVPNGLTEMRYAVDRLDKQDKLFELIFPRIAYRYQYEDGEYSAISPFSQPVFLPGTFDYHPKKAHNLGMVNRITSVNITNFNNSTPDGVTAIDIIYKDDSSPNLYVIDTVKPQHIGVTKITGQATAGMNSWEVDTYIITDEQIGRAIESNQILRPWDNVPKKALGQEISGNRIIYGNYTQGYSLKLADGDDYYPNLDVIPLSSPVSGAAKPSIKSLREYQIGAVFVDKYGRETPVVSNTTGTIKLGKELSDNQNKLKVEFDDDKPPVDLTHVKFFIKETAGEYYNLAMDRFYDAEDGHLWLSFPSSDRNKLSIDDYLILKKAVEGNILVEDNNKYKVLDIKNEAPEFIKQRKLITEELTHITSSVAGTAVVDIFGSTMMDAPREGFDTFKLNYKAFSRGSASKIHEIEEDIYVEFLDTLSNQVSKRYEVTSLSTDFIVGNPTPTIDDSIYTFKLLKLLGDDVGFMSDGNKIKDNIAIRIYKYIPKNTAQFDGRFFVKISGDASSSENIVTASQIEVASDPQYRVISSKKVGIIRNDHETRHRHDLTGLKMGVYRDRSNTGINSPSNHLHNASINGYNCFTEDGSTNKALYGGFGPWACYFRNYNTAPGSYYAKRRGYSANTDISQYRFNSLRTDNGSNIEWHHELGWITGGSYLHRGGSIIPETLPKVAYKIPDYYMGGSSLPSAWAKTKNADDHGWKNDNSTQDRENNAVWYLNGGPRAGTRWTTNTYPVLAWATASGTFADGNGKGIDIYSTSATWKLAVGGIYHKDVLTSTDQEIGGFFGIGDNNTTAGTFNNHYQSNSIKSIVQQLKGGTKIRWKEDPTNQIHTIQTVSAENGVINYYKHTTSGGSDPDYSGAAPNNDVDFFDRAAAQLSPNFSVQWDIRTKNSNGGYTANWNPATDTLGPIENGIEIHVNASGNGTGLSSPFVPKVHVSSLINNDVNGVSRTITTGMILTKHGSTTYNGALASGTPPLSRGELLIYKISGTGPYTLWLTGYREPLVAFNNNTSNSIGLYRHHFYDYRPNAGDVMVFKQPTMNGYSQFSCNRINAQNAMNMAGTGVYDEVTLPNSNGNQSSDGAPRIMPVLYTLEFVEEIEKEAGLPNNPAIWETEPKIAPLLDIYYEASGYNPLVLTEETKYIALPIGSKVSHFENSASVMDGTTIHTVGYDPVVTLAVGGTHTGGWYILTNEGTASLLAPLVGGSYIVIGDNLNITKPDGSIISVKVTGHSTDTLFFAGNRSRKIYISDNLYKDSTYTLNWHNCYAFGNGVESNRIRDSFNAVYISNGVKASATIDQEYIEEHRKNGLIYSGIYNSNSGVNNLNQFIMAEKITKDLSPSYGSIQKLYSRDSDLIALCEDKVLQIFANKDALYNADGNINLVSTSNVLGIAKPFVGDYGISTNPESFASETYRAYFTDRVRGAVVRLSMDGLTAISDHGMKDWFRDNLSLGKTNLLGENCLDSQANWDILNTNNCKVVNGEAIIGFYNSDANTLVAFDANNKTSDTRFGRSAQLTMDNVLTIGNTYRLQYDVVKIGGYNRGTATTNSAQPPTGLPSSLVINNTASGTNWEAGPQTPPVEGDHVVIEWVAKRTTFGLHQFAVDYNDNNGVRNYGGVGTKDFVNSILTSGTTQWASNGGFYGGTVSIKNIILEEVKQPLKLIGSYDDRQNEYNITVNSVIPTTVSFKEDVRGWVSFKSFIPENGLSCANDYYTLKDGKLWQHHNPGIHRNTFYGQYTNSSFNALLNSVPSSIKSYHTLEYEGSKSRVEGIKTVTVTGIQHSDGPSEDGKYFFFEEEEMNNLISDSNWVDTTVTINQYRNNTLVYSGNVRIFDNSSVNSNSPTSLSGGPTKGHGRRNTGSEVGQWQVGDIITTQQLHMPGQTTISLQIVDPLNSTPQDGWFVSNIKTDKKQGSLLEFVEKEGKWFNYIKGVPTDYNSTDYFPDDFDFASFDVQGLGVIESSDTTTKTITITSGVNISLQIGDCIYYNATTSAFGFTKLDTSLLVKLGIVTNISGDTVTLDSIVGTAATRLGKYCIFVKDQIVNMSGLSGYYANAKFENNSKDKAELFVISSEISESSK